MKKSILTLAILGAATLAAVHFAAPPASKPAAIETPEAATPSGTMQTTAAKAAPLPPIKRQAAATKTKAGAATREGAAMSSAEEIALAAMIDTLVSPKSAYLEKQAAWKQLLDSGRIQDAIANLEQRAANDPNNAEVAAALGQAYLKACGTTKDVRSQAVWAMEADRTFETALNLDPGNWDARFTKTVAMTFWPADLNKGPEIVDQFNTLIQQQEKEAPQPQFAATYDWLGRQYEKMGQADLAQQVWARGAALFPENETLRGRLASNP